MTLSVCLLILYLSDPLQGYEVEETSTANSKLPTVLGAVRVSHQSSGTKPQGKRSCAFLANSKKCNRKVSRTLLETLDVDHV